MNPTQRVLFAPHEAALRRGAAHYRRRKKQRRDAERQDAAEFAAIVRAARNAGMPIPHIEQAIGGLWRRTWITKMCPKETTRQ